MQKPRWKAARRERDKARVRALLRPLIPQLKKQFREKMAEMAKQAAQIENEKLRTDLLNLIKSFLRALGGYRQWDELFEFVESSTETMRMGIAMGLYGHWDPRTQKTFDAAEARAEDRVMMANRGDT